MPTAPSRALCLCAAMLAATLTGCAAERLKAVAPPSAPKLVGRWTLDRAQSEHVDAAVMSLETQLRGLLRRARRAAQRAEQAQGEREPPRRRGERNAASPPAGEAGGGEPTLHEPGVVVSAPLLGASWVREFIGHVPVGSYLGVRLTPEAFSVHSAGGIQQCTLGVPTAIAYGHSGANQMCGWEGHDFLIVVKPLLGPQLTERFALSPNGELVMTLHLAGHGINVRLIRRYRRTPHATPPVLLPTSD